VFVGWPGEVFVEFGLQVKDAWPKCCIITQANGELQGYLVTEEAIHQRTYEALNAIFASPQSGQLLVNTTMKMLESF
jgi:hypothetical protein